MLALFERPLDPGWVYPCTVEDIRCGLSRLPAEDLDGIWAVGLVPSTRDNGVAYAMYHPGCKPMIRIPAWRDSFALRHWAGTRRSELYAEHGVELAYGMSLEQVGNRWVSRWEYEDLRRYLVEHVLPHEVGHHVCHTQRIREGLEPCPGAVACEQFAEDYALRLNRDIVAVRRRHSSLRHCHTWPHGYRPPHRPNPSPRLHPAQRF